MKWIWKPKVLSIVTQLEVIIGPYQLINEISLMVCYNTISSYVEILSIHSKNLKFYYNNPQQINWSRNSTVFFPPDPTSMTNI